MYSSSIETTRYGVGKHTIQIFADFQCPACIAFSKVIGPILESHAASGKVVLEYRQYPLTSIHKNAYRDALAALCASDQKKYGNYKLALYALEEKKRGAAISDDERIALALQTGITDKDGFAQCLTSDAKKSQVDADIALGDSLRISGTPTVLLDGRPMNLGVIFADLEKGKQYLDRVLSE